MRTIARILTTGVLAAAALTVSSGTAQADPWDPWLPGVPNIGGPGVNVGVPGNPLPPGQVKNAIDDLIPNFGGGGRGKWR